MKNNFSVAAIMKKKKTLLRASSLFFQAPNEIRYGGAK